MVVNMAYGYDGKKLIKVSGTYIEPTLSKSIFYDNNLNSLWIEKGYYDYRVRKYPDMKQFHFGQRNKRVYDIDFNNFFLFSFKEYLIKNNIKNRLADRFIKKINRATYILNNNREQLKNSYVVFYSNCRLDFISDYIEIFGTTDKKLSVRQFMNIINKICGDTVREDCIDDLILELEEYEGYFYIVNKYQFIKYKYLAGIGWIKRFYEPLWWNIMKHASEKLIRTVKYAKENGATVYNIYIDSIQTDTNLLKKFPELFNEFPAKLDKEGNTYGLCLPPSYWLGKHKAIWLEIDYEYYFNNYRTEEINIINTQLIYLYNFCKKNNHPLANYITVDYKNRIIQTYKIPKIEPYMFNFNINEDRLTESFNPNLI